MGDAHMGLQARLMSQALRKLTGTISKSNCCVIFINQIRMKIGVMFGNPETTTGGNALKFYASVRMDIRKIAAIKAGQDVVGSRTRVKVVKNKVAPPFKEAEFDITYGTGISRVGDIVDLGSESGVIDKSGAWFSYNGERVGQGRENAKQYLLDHPETCAAIEAKILEHYGLTARTPKNDQPPRRERRSMELNDILKFARTAGASDVHIKAGLPPVYRINGELKPLSKAPHLTREMTHAMAFNIMSAKQKQRYEDVHEVDIAYGVAGLGRFRANIFAQRGAVSMVFRFIPFDIKNLDDLVLPAVIKEIISERRGVTRL
jgi:hypothetical protein